MFHKDSSRFVHMRTENECAGGVGEGSPCAARSKETDEVTAPAVLALGDGSIFRGHSIGAPGNTTGEVVFNTAITGYQEILTDPSYARQIVTLTYPHIGNCGVTPEDMESAQVYASGLIVRDLSMVSSNWRAVEPLGDFLQRAKVVAIAGIDTRRLTRLLREKGAQSGCIMTGERVDEAVAVRAARAFPGLKGMDLAKVVTTREPYQWNDGTIGRESLNLVRAQQRLHVVAYDYGVKRNILRLLADQGCRITVVPATTSSQEVLSVSPDGIFLSNGPGDPEPCDYAIRSISELLTTDLPVFGICLGHQLLGLASGAKTLKMKFGHHGANHPVQELASGKVMITSQNHGFAVDEATLGDKLVPTHRSLFDGSLQGVARVDCPAFSFQGHPEASPGPHDLKPLFEHFIQLMVRRLQNQLKQMRANARKQSAEG
jgi:carbamoyl-phosphate synthase small subunit